MLEGLEVSEIRLSELERTKRIDSDFYSKKNIDDLKKLVSVKAQSITNFVSVSDGNHMSISEDYCDDGVPYYRGTDIYNFFIEQASNNLKIEKRIFDTPNMRRSHLKKGDILMSIVGAIIGNLSLVKTNADATCSCKLAIMRPKKIQSEFFAVFLQSAYGQNQIQKFKRGSAQTGLILEDFEQILIPDFSDHLITQVTDVVNSAFAVLEQSKTSYAQAEQALLEAVGLADFKPSTQNTNIKTYAQSFGASGRLDAEYYQPKYDYLENVFNQFERIRLQDLVNYPISSGITPKAGGDDYTDAESGIPFVRAVDLQNGLVSIDNFNYIKPEIHTGVLKRTQLKQNDFLFSIAGTVGRCAIFEHTFEANINQAVAILRFNDARVNPYYLMLFFNSYTGKEFVEKYSRQGLQTNLNLAEVGDLSVPIIGLATQTKISQLVQQSFTLKAQSEHLLSVAKRAVEMAIEQDEAAAMHFIENSTN